MSLLDGGLPFALPLTIDAGSAPWWQGADPAVSSLQTTTVVAAHAQRVAGRDQAVAAHPRLERATRYCLSASEAIDRPPFAYELAFAVGFLDAAYDAHPERPTSSSGSASMFPATARYASRAAPNRRCCTRSTSPPTLTGRRGDCSRHSTRGWAGRRRLAGRRRRGWRM